MKLILYKFCAYKAYYWLKKYDEWSAILVMHAGHHGCDHWCWAARKQFLAAEKYLKWKSRCEKYAL